MGAGASGGSASGGSASGAMRGGGAAAAKSSAADCAADAIASDAPGLGAGVGMPPAPPSALLAALRAPGPNFPPPSLLLIGVSDRCARRSTITADPRSVDVAFPVLRSRWTRASDGWNSTRRGKNPLTSHRDCGLRIVRVRSIDSKGIAARCAAMHASFRRCAAGPDSLHRRQTILPDLSESLVFQGFLASPRVGTHLVTVIREATADRFPIAGERHEVVEGCMQSGSRHGSASRTHRISTQPRVGASE